MSEIKTGDQLTIAALRGRNCELVQERDTAREQIKKSLEREKQIERELDESRAQVAVLCGALEEVRKGHIESKFDNEDGRFVEVFVRDVHIVIDQALEQTPEEATEIVSKLAENMVMKALFEWRRDE